MPSAAANSWTENSRIPGAPGPANASTVSPKTGSPGSRASSECMAAHWAAALSRSASAASAAARRLRTNPSTSTAESVASPGPVPGSGVVSRERSCMSQAKQAPPTVTPADQGVLHSPGPQSFVSLCGCPFGRDHEGRVALDGRGSDSGGRAVARPRRRAATDCRLLGDQPTSRRPATAPWSRQARPTSRPVAGSFTAPHR